MKERGFQQLTDNTIFVSSDAVLVSPFGTGTYDPGPVQVISFIDTGLTPQMLPPYFGAADLCGSVLPIRAQPPTDSSWLVAMASYEPTFHTVSRP